MLINERSDGVFVISITPFLDDGELDLKSVPGLVEFYLERGATELTVLGMMGEAPKLTQAESVAFVSCVLEAVAGRVPVVVGVSGGGLAPMRALTRTVMELGAGGVMVAPPSSLKTDQQIVHYYAAVAEAIGRDVPFVLQDFPLSTSAVQWHS